MLWHATHIISNKSHWLRVPNQIAIILCNFYLSLCIITVAYRTHTHTRFPLRVYFFETLFPRAFSWLMETTILLLHHISCAYNNNKSDKHNDAIEYISILSASARASYEVAPDRYIVKKMKYLISFVCLRLRVIRIILWMPLLHCLATAHFICMDSC